MGTVALCGCVPVMVGTAAGAALGVSLGTRLDRSAPRGTGADVGSAVVVRFSVPRDIQAAVMRYDRSARGVPTDSVGVRAVTTLSGRITNNVGDSLVIALSEATGARGRVTFGGKHSTTILRDSSAKVRVLSSHPARSTGVFLGALVGMISVSVWYLLTMDSRT